MLAAAFPLSAKGECVTCDGCEPRVALRTNMLYDAALTPSLGLEAGFARHFSVAADAVAAWWSNDSRHRYWRICGGLLEGRVWIGSRGGKRALTGHHIGIYGSIHTFDFEFGGTGYQSPRMTYGAGLGYGYSFRISGRLNLDLGIKGGYSAGRQIKYRPECGSYVAVRRSFHQYWGITGVEVTLVWFPGRGRNNHPDYL